MARIITSMDEFAALIDSMEDEYTEAAVESVRRAQGRTQRALINASKSATNGDRVLSRVGRATGEGTRVGSYLGYKVERSSGLAFRISKTGQWQLVDDSVNPGRTKRSFIAPDPVANPRPIRPGGRYAPSVKTPGGGFHRRGKWRRGHSRRPYWANAWQSVQPRIWRESTGEFTKALRKAGF